MKNRYKDGEVYRFSHTIKDNPEFSQKIQARERVDAILNSGNVTPEHIQDQREIARSMSEDVKKYQPRNILSFSKFDEKKVGSGKDSAVFAIKKYKNYVYKEAFHGSIEEMMYLRHKYLILKKYLGDIIPKSYFAYGESTNSKLKWVHHGFDEKIFTIQQKIHGKDLSKLSLEEKGDEKLLEALKISHKKYILLKYFLSSRLRALKFHDQSMDLQLDLGPLSDKDSFPQEDVNFIETNLKSPNIMWDGEKIYFIDFGSGTWDETRQKIFDDMMKEKTFKSWKQILRAYNL